MEKKGRILIDFDITKIKPRNKETKQVHKSSRTAKIKPKY